MNPLLRRATLAVLISLSVLAPAAAQDAWRLRATSYYTLMSWMGHGMADSTDYQYLSPADTNPSQLRFYTAQADRSVRWVGRTDVIQYTASGDSASVEVRQYDTAFGTYQVLGRHEYTYNAQGLRDEHTYLEFDFAAGRYKFRERELFLYDATGKLVERTTQYGDYPAGAQWLNYGRTYFRYNSLGRLRNNSGYLWNVNQMRWVLNDSTDHSYDPSDTVYLGYVSHVRNTATGRTFPIWRVRVDQVDGSGRALQEYEDRYDSAARQWDPSAGIRYVYDAQGRTTKMQLGFWDATSGTYDYPTQTDYFYHVPSGKLSKSLYSALNTSPQYMQERNYYYEAVSLGVKRVRKANTGASILAYPQPAQHEMKLRVRLDKPQQYAISVLDMQGRCLQRQTGMQGAEAVLSVPVGSLPAGTYSVVLEGDAGAVASQLITVQH